MSSATIVKSIQSVCVCVSYK